MPTLRVQYVSKTGALIDEPKFIEADYVPRVGELLDAHSVFGDGQDHMFIVASVIHRVTEKGLMPCITANSWYKGLRSELLEEYGWLPQTDSTILTYDEDKYFD